MKTQQIINLDYREKENEEIIQKVLRKIKPLSKYSDEEIIPLEVLEKTISVITNKYSIQPQWVSCTYTGNAPGVFVTYSVGVKTSDTHTWLGTVNACSMYELFAKVTIYMYSHIKSGNIRLREPKIFEKERKGKTDEN